MRNQDPVVDVLQEYVKSPIEFTVELDIQARLAELFRTELRQDGSLYAHFENERVNYTQQLPNYKESYADHLIQKVDAIDEPFSRVHTEVTPYAELIEDVNRRERIDIVMFSETLKNPVNWRSGSQRHHWDDFEVAVEIKYIKNKSKVPASINSTDILDASMDELRSRVDLDANGIRPDLEELARLPDSTDKYLILVSNLDYLYIGNLDDLDSTKQKRYQRLGHAAVKEIQSIARDVNTIYAHPTGWQWLTGAGIENPCEP